MKFQFNYSPFLIESGKVREFARSLGLKNKAYYDKDYALSKGYPDMPVPLTFLTVIDYSNEKNLYDLFDYLNIEANKTLHGEQSYNFIKDIYVGDMITGNVYIKDMKVKEGKTFYYLETIYRKQDNMKVAINNSTLINITEV